MVNSTAILVPCLVVAVPFIVYFGFLGLVTIPWFQRNVIYAHKIHSLWWGNINEPEQWGFAENQVTPFRITTPDGESLYAWHVLPLSIYAQHESTLSSQPGGLSPDITTTENFRLLRDDPNAKLIITSQLTQGYRPQHYHTLTGPHSPYHLLAIDYRGFGLSSGSPTESGLALDAEAAVRWAVETARVPPERIVIVGHSLGTAVTAALMERLILGSATASGSSCSSPASNSDPSGSELTRDDDTSWNFAGIVQIAPFSSLPDMLSDYAIAGLIPVLRPLKWAWPWGVRKLLSRLVDRWDSAGRWRRIARAVSERGGRLRITFVHAKNDRDIPPKEDDLLFQAVVEGMLGGDRRWDDGEGFEMEKKKRVVVKGKNEFVAEWREGDVVVRQELVPHGGHNAVLVSAPVLLAVARSFDSDAESAV
ncbi:hypothetical protein VTJ49DRAFT_4180 [Mycothermus thermophilus]|uniref:AB hydrolase-1 domain-containing protein n=1 Tax=Humicola insolens TaxID=85995 RepID=A0ABR3V611_HUMIN